MLFGALGHWHAVYTGWCRTRAPSPGVRKIDERSQGLSNPPVTDRCAALPPSLLDGSTSLVGAPRD